MLLSIVATATLQYAYPYPDEPELPRYTPQFIQEDSFSVTPRTKNKSRSPIPDVPLPTDEASVQATTYTDQLQKYSQEMETYDAAVDANDTNSNIIILVVAAVFVVIAGILYRKVAVFPESLMTGALFLALSASSFETFDFSYSGYGEVMLAGGSGITLVQLLTFYACLLIAIVIGFVIFVKKQPAIQQHPQS